MKLPPNGIHGQFDHELVGDPYAAGCVGAFRAFAEHSVAVDVVYDDTALDDYEVVYVPMAVRTTPEFATSVAAFVEGGGTVVMEGGTGFYDEAGWVSEVVPPYGLSDLFGVEESSARFHLVGHRSDMVYGLPTGHRTAELRVTTVNVLSTFDDGTPAVTERVVGLGRAIYFASVPSVACFSRPEHVGRGLLDVIGINPADLPPGVRVIRTKGSDGRGVTFAFNHGEEETWVELDQEQGWAPVRGGAPGPAAGTGIIVPARDVVVLREPAG